jgi:RND family efflux transporter MFP subunit
MMLTVAGVARRKDAFVRHERIERERATALGPSVSVVKVAMQPPTRTLTLTGEVKPFRQVTLYAKVSGYLKEVLFDKGDEVKKGQVLGILESPETEQVARAASADLSAKRRSAARFRTLAEQGLASKLDAERAVADSDMAAASYIRARSLKDYAVIRAPFDGIVTARQADPGALLQAATSAVPGALPLAEVADLSRVRVRVYVGPFDAPFVREGTPVTLWTDARPDRTMKASITRFTRALDARTRTMMCEIEVDNTDRSLYAGTPVRVRLEVETPRVPVVPAEAVNIRDGKPHVALVRNGHAAFVPVDLGEDDGKVVRVQRGVREGDAVIINVGDEVSDGAPVQPVARDTAKPAGGAR